MKKIALVSACLLGVPTRYDGTGKQNAEVLALSKEYLLIPFCPEQLGGLSTPRKPAEIVGERVINVDGEDVTEFFVRGAQVSLQIAEKIGPNVVILKEGSPSCGVHFVYDGTFQGRKVEGQGLTAKLLREKHPVLCENDLEKLEQV
ncbi:MAG TPA: DUF523 domain-containing protein [Bacillota bacterium]|nr:DUF523 domain-containing protein [Bacillota bacterium]HPZ72730.1 DUF523 domain-containing protein [Bacillota bacterium]HQD77722.1 DUF523 domain-containing protein [Bacillota bacterium]